MGWIQRLFEDEDDEAPPSTKPVICLEDALFDAPLHAPYGLHEEMASVPFPGLPDLLPCEPTHYPSDLPSIGSASHYLGECRPCAFLHAKGCMNLGHFLIVVFRSSALGVSMDFIICRCLRLTVQYDFSSQPRNGALCSFCHLCDKGEKKRRQKAKKAMFQSLTGGAI